MLTEAMLAGITTVIVHENGPGNACPDGTASAIILRDALPRSVEVLFRNHAALVREVPRPHTLFCDIAPPLSTAHEWNKQEAIVLDHHEKQEGVVKIFGERGIYSNTPGESGAVLAFKHVWMTIRSRLVVATTEFRAEQFAMLAGVRDTWQKQSEHWNSACEQAEALRFWSWEAFTEEPFNHQAHRFAEQMRIGKPLRDKRLTTAKMLVKEALGVEVAGLKMLIVNSLETSDAAEEVKEADILVGFRFIHDPATDTELMVLSFRARGDYDVGALAQSLGGGGHRAAAGASVSTILLSQMVPASNLRNPYSTIEWLVERHQSISKGRLIL